MLYTENNLKQIENILIKSGEKIEGNIYCDINTTNLMPRREEKIANLKHFCSGLSKIGEIGFNAGHSALAMLESSPSAEYVFFDIGVHGYVQDCFDFLKRSFSNASLDIIYGDSKKSVWNYIISHERLEQVLNSFDLIHMDGGHGPDTIERDYAHSMLLLKKNGILIIDDGNIPQIKSLINNKLQLDDIEELYWQPVDGRQRIFRKL